jgi:ABC-type oligopeptide transport system substrate-binding subunit
VFADRALRRALAGAVDRAAVVRNVFDSLATPASVPAPRAVAGAIADQLMGPTYDPR